MVKVYKNYIQLRTVRPTGRPPPLDQPNSTCSTWRICCYSTKLYKHHQIHPMNNSELFLGVATLILGIPFIRKLMNPNFLAIIMQDPRGILVHEYCCECHKTCCLLTHLNKLYKLLWIRASKVSILVVALHTKAGIEGIHFGQNTRKKPYINPLIYPSKPVDCPQKYKSAHELPKKPSTF